MISCDNDKEIIHTKKWAVVKLLNIKLVSKTNIACDSAQKSAQKMHKKILLLINNEHTLLNVQLQ